MLAVNMLAIGIPVAGVLAAGVPTAEAFLSNYNAKAAAAGIPAARTFLSIIYLIVFAFLIVNIVMQGQYLCQIGYTYLF